MRLDSPFVLATAGTLAIHLLLAVAGDAIVVLYPHKQYEEAPRVELIDIEVPPVVKPPPPPVQPERPEPVKETRPVPQTVQKVVRQQPTAPPPPENEPPPPVDTPPSGGAPLATMEGVIPSATGVPVAVGKRTSEHVGRGGTGTGTGAGSGTGSSDEPPKPVSVATIKARAMPKGDFSYFDASKDYPAEAKSLGIEGVIRVRLVVDEQGKVKSTVLLNKLGHGLDELALERAKKIEFEPAKDTDDKAVSSVVVWTFNMTLPK
ncbi:MAG TPA: energy transducer TonB [Kofleriaceae bacterium]|nr:energy transducer TonB [Kofleriaceae bacterium]